MQILGGDERPRTSPLFLSRVGIARSTRSSSTLTSPLLDVVTLKWIRVATSIHTRLPPFQTQPNYKSRPNKLLILLVNDLLAGWWRWAGHQHDQERPHFCFFCHGTPTFKFQWFHKSSRRHMQNKPNIALSMFPNGSGRQSSCLEFIVCNHTNISNMSFLNGALLVGHTACTAQYNSTL